MRTETNIPTPAILQAQPDQRTDATQSFYSISDEWCSIDRILKKPSGIA